MLLELNIDPMHFAGMRAITMTGFIVKVSKKGAKKRKNRNGQESISAHKWQVGFYVQCLLSQHAVALDVTSSLQV